MYYLFIDTSVYI